MIFCVQKFLANLNNKILKVKIILGVWMICKKIRSFLFDLRARL